MTSTTRQLLYFVAGLIATATNAAVVGWIGTSILMIGNSVSFRFLVSWMFLLGFCGAGFVLSAMGTWVMFSAAVRGTHSARPMFDGQFNRSQPVNETLRAFAFGGALGGIVRGQRAITEAKAVGKEPNAIIESVVIASVAILGLAGVAIVVLVVVSLQHQP